MLHDFRPDVVLCDWRLPGLSGQQVVREVRSEPEIAATSMICLTAFDDELTRQAAYESGFDHHLVKPPEIDTLEEPLSRPLFR